jgi:hypothetical protein
MLEDLGGLIEFEIIDRLLDKKTKKHKANWKKYLQLKTKDEYVGQRYIRTVVTRLKFELSMAPALILLGIGIQWLELIYGTWDMKGIVGIIGFLGALVVYLFWQAWLSAEALSETREGLLETMEKKPEPDPKHLMPPTEVKPAG